METRMAKGDGILLAGSARSPGRAAATGIGLLAAIALALGVPGVAVAVPGGDDSRLEVAPGVHLAPASELASSQPSSRPPRRRRSAPSARIVGGDATTIASWPWQTSIGVSGSIFAGNGFARHVCGGALVAPRVVVTAAHCFYEVIGEEGEGFDDPDLFQAITGRTQLSSGAGQVHDFTDYFVFVDDLGLPLYDPSTDQWDVVFVLLASPSSQGTIKVAGPGEEAVWAAGREAFVTGWGTTSEGGDPSDVLRRARIEMIDDATCGSSLVYGAAFVPAVMVCAGQLAGGIDSCQGDSGGPLVVPIAGGGYRLVGDTSWGVGCARANRPGVYGRLAADPVRSALREGILAVAGVEVVGSGAQPPAPGELPSGDDPPPSGDSPTDSNEFGFGRLNRKPRRGTAILMVTVSGPGTVSLAQTGQVRGALRQVGGAVAGARAAGRVRLPVRPRGKARRKVNRAGRARVKAKVTYTPSGGEARTKSRRVRLVKR